MLKLLRLMEGFKPGVLLQRLIVALQPIIKSWLWFPNMVYANKIDMELQTLQNLCGLHIHWIPKSLISPKSINRVNNSPLNGNEE